MKKILSLLITVLLVMSALCTMPVFAADTVDVTVDVSLYDVTVTAITNKSGTMTAQLTDEYITTFYGMYSAKSTPAQDDGEYIYNFRFRLPDGTNRPVAGTGVYKIRFGNNVSTDPVTFNFVSPRDRITFYNELNDKAAGDIYKFLTVDRSSFVTIDLTDYSALTGNVLNLVNAEIVDFGETYSDITAGDTATLSTVETNFKTAFSTAMTIASMATVTEQEWEEFVDDMFGDTTFDDTYYADTVDTEALLEVADVYSYYKTEIEEITVLDSAEYAKAFDKATLHLVEETADYGTFKTVFLYFENQGVITPDMTNINAIVSAGKDATLWKNVMADDNANCQALVDNAVSEAATLIENGILSSTPITGGGGGAGGSTSVDKPSVPNGSGTVSGGNTPEIKPVEPTPTGKFTDVKEAQWAYDAIEALADKGILNGKGDGKFAPDSGVTREEFVKIIVMAFDLSVDADHTFSDVADDRWSSEFIAAAAHHGIVAGNGESFNPGAAISRQDMAVIIHRVFEKLGAKVSGEAISFDDNAEIDDL